MIGRIASVEHGGPNVLNIVSTVIRLVRAGFVARRRSRVTVNAGLRWEPSARSACRQRRRRDLRDGQLPEERPQQRCSTTRRPVSIYPGDPGFPKGIPGLKTRSGGTSRRARGVAWDVHGDGRLAVRSSYSMGYDFMPGEVPQHQRGRAAVRQPLDHHGSAGGLDDP